MSLFSPEEWRRAEPIIDEAFELPPSEVAEFLDRACDGDVELRARIERMLSARSVVADALRVPAAALAAPLIDVEGASANEADSLDAGGRRVGAYRLLREIGRGGMGTVYLAERADDQYRKKVAVKLVRFGAAAADLVRRFRYERQILASLDHPNVARLLDGGIENDVPYFVMEYVEGEPIDSFCSARDLPTDERLRLFRDVCSAVQYAHRNLVVHRDLKPSNILVTDEGVVKLLDFGIAKLLDVPDDVEDVPVTQTGLRVMTPEYASPEQVMGNAVTTATDVYALGILLYEILVGVRPFDLRGKSTAEIERVICEVEPVRPSTVSARLRRRLAGDLDTIILKALQKDPERRYATVDALIDDLRRFEHGLPVLARPDSVLYRGMKFVRRHRVGVLVTVLFLSVAVAAAGRERGLRSRAEAEARRAEAVKEFLVGVFRESDPYAQSEGAGGEVTARELLDRGVERVDLDLSNDPSLQAEMLGVLGDLYANIGLYDQAEMLLTRSLDSRRARFGERSAPVASALADLGQLFSRRGRYDEAERLLRDGLARKQRLFGKQHAEVAEVMDRLASLLQEKNELDEAEALFRAALDIRRKLPGPSEIPVAQSLNNIALLLFWKSEYAAAEPLYREALAIRVTHLGQESLWVAETMHNLAQVLHLLERLEESDSLFQRSIEIKRRRLPGPHPSMSVHLNNYARVLRDQARYDEAERVTREALEMDLVVFGDEHPYTAASLDNLAVLLRGRGRLEEAEGLFRRSLEVNRTLRGEDHTTVGLALNNLAGVLLEQERFDEAHVLFERAIEIYRQRLGQDHLYTTLVTVNMSAAVRELGRYVEAESLYTDSIGRLEAIQPQGRERLALALVGRAQTLLESGRAAEALADVERGAAMLAEQFGPDDWHTAEAHVVLGRCLAALARFDEARPMLQASRDVLAQTRGETSRSARQAAAALASIGRS